jgi:hypothetical protein
LTICKLKHNQKATIIIIRDYIIYKDWTTKKKINVELVTIHINKPNNKPKQAEKEIIIKAFCIQLAANLLPKFWPETVKTTVWFHKMIPVRCQNWTFSNKRLNT